MLGAIPYSLIICPEDNNQWRIEGMDKTDISILYIGSFENCLRDFKDFEKTFKEDGNEIVEPDLKGYSMELGLRIRWGYRLAMSHNYKDKLMHELFIENNPLYSKYVKIEKPVDETDND